MHIEQAGIEHVELLAPVLDLYRQAIGESPDPKGAEAFLRERYQNGQAVTYMALTRADTGLEVMGFVNLYPCYTTLGLKPLWILNDLFVHAGYRREGVAKALMERAAQLGRESGAARLELKTQKGNHSAQALYESLGWKRMQDSYHYNLDM